MVFSENEPQVEQFFKDDGSLKQIPAKQSKKIAVLKIIASSLEPNRRYSEKELNQLIARFSDDTAAIRRHMIEFKILERNTESIYWLSN